MRNHRKLLLLVLCTPLAATTCFMEPVDSGSTNRTAGWDGVLSTVIEPGDREIFTNIDETDTVETACDKTSLDAHKILNDNCAACHNAGAASRGSAPVFDFVMDDMKMMTTDWEPQGAPKIKFLVPGDPNNSAIYLRAAIRRDMPPLQLSVDQPFYPRVDYSAAAVLQDWIKNCVGSSGGDTGGGGNGGEGGGGASGNGGSGAASAGAGGSGAGGTAGGGGVGGGAAGAGGAAGGTGGAAGGAGGRGGAAGGAGGTAGAGGGGVNGDTAKYNFENGTQLWAGTMRAGLGNLTQVTTSQNTVFAGMRSLRGNFTSPAGMTTYEMAVVNPTPTVPAGATITFHYFVPTGSQIGFVQPFVTDSTAGSFINNFIANPMTGAWQTATVNVPANANLPITNMGFQFGTTGAFTGSIFVDSINW
jgi:hypothetical protein